jgi:hypothetical protein
MNDMLEFRSGDKVKLTSFDFTSLSLAGEFREVPYGTEGVIKSAKRHTSQYNRDEYEVDFGSFGVHPSVPDYLLRKTKGSENFNDRDRIKETYESWVDRITEDCDWVTNISMGQVQEQYSKIALRYALDILENLERSTDPIADIKNKISEIDKILNEDI